MRVGPAELPPDEPPPDEPPDPVPPPAGVAKVSEPSEAMPVTNWPLDPTVAFTPPSAEAVAAGRRAAGRVPAVRSVAEPDVATAARLGLPVRSA